MRPKLDYGCVIYNSASEQTPSTLNAVLNEAMRVVHLRPLAWSVCTSLPTSPLYANVGKT